MTEYTVTASITISVGKREKRIEKIVNAKEIEEIAQEIGVEVGQQILQSGIKEIDQQIAEQIPQGWHNVGTEERWVTSSVGELRYKRRIYVDEQKHRRKPVDELLGLEEKGRMSRRVRKWAIWLVGTYRRAACELSWLLKTPVSHSAVQRMVWQTGENYGRRRSRTARGYLKTEKKYWEGQMWHRYCTEKVMGYGCICSAKREDQQKYESQ